MAKVTTLLGVSYCM